MDVKERPDLERGLPGYSQRFKVLLADEAWSIYSEAVKHGFEASAEHVKPMKVSA